MIRSSSLERWVGQPLSLASQERRFSSETPPRAQSKAALTLMSMEMVDSQTRRVKDLKKRSRVTLRSSSRSLQAFFIPLEIVGADVSPLTSFTDVLRLFVLQLSFKPCGMQCAAVSEHRRGWAHTRRLGSLLPSSCHDEAVRLPAA